MIRLRFILALAVALVAWLSAPAARGASMADGPGGPILVVTTTSNAFGNYYAEILRAEGLNEFAVTDITLVTPAALNAYDVVILGQLALTTDQTTMFANWVNGGGNLIAMQPDKKLAGLLGLTDASATLSNAYLRVYGTGAGAGIVTTPIQFHGVADRYNTNGATVLASLYADSTTDMLQPAVTLRSVGTNGGHAAAFTFDLARSVVYTRQGNPAWAGQARDGLTPIRSDDLFYGAASFDPQPDWADLSRVAIPQADEQQRLLANLIGQINLGRKPLPRFWYFPKGKKAVVVMTADQHDCGNGTRDRFQRYVALDPPGGSVADWDCARASAYNFCYINMGDAEAKSWTDQGFELGIHLNTGCANWTPVQLESFFASQLASFAQQFPSLPGQVSHRTHCIAWSDWVTTAKVSLAHGIRLDMTYYYYPPAWVLNRPGFFTGSGLPMRFADLDGTMIDVYQATTQMTDESGQSYPYTIDTLLDLALGPEGYYGAFGVNIHTDTTSLTQDVAIVSSARARGVPVVSGRQMLEWLDGRNGSSFNNITWSGGVLAFTVVAAPGARNLQAMVPTTVAGRALTGVYYGSSPVAYTAQTVKGIEYACFSTSNGTYQVSYTPGFIDTTLADFAAGTLDTNTCITQTADGEVILKPTVGAEFSGPTLPAGWSATNWSGGGSITFAAGGLTIDGAIVGATTSYAPGRSLEFVATFNAAASQHAGLAADLAFNAPWAIFSTFSSTTSLYARSSDGSSVLLPGNWIGAPHRFRVDWTTTKVVFTIDGTAVATNSVALMGNMRPVASDFAVGAPTLSVDWMRMSPYASAGTFLSQVVDAGVPVNWGTLSWGGQLPDGASLALSYRTGNTPAPDGSWTAPIPIDVSGGLLEGNSRYFQHVAQLSTTDPTQTPTLNDVEISYNFGEDITPPAIISRSPAPGTTNVPSNASVTLEFSEPMDVSTITSASIRLRRVGELIDIPATVTASGILATLTPLSPLIAGVSFQVTVAGTAADLSGNQLGSDVVWNFSTASVIANQIDTTIADFGAGLLDANSYVAQTADGEVMLNPTLGTEFYGSTLPGGWSSANWASGGSVAVAGGSLTIDGAVAGTTASYGPGRTLEFAARFNAAAFQHVGFAADLTFNAPWAIFSTSSTTNSLYTRTSDGWSQLLPGNWLGTPHRFRIDWNLTNVLFSIDSVLVATSPIALAGNMRPVASDFTVGGQHLAVDWERLNPYAAAGTFLSRVFDAGASVTWHSLTWTASNPAGTTVVLSYREGNTPAPDASWSGFTASSASGAAIVGNSRYLQYRADLATADTKQTSVLQDVAVAWNLNPIVVVPAIVWSNPANIAYGTPLGPAQLNATASFPGTFAYSPPAATVLSPGSNQTLSVSFVPNDPINYTSASATVHINVLASGSLEPHLDTILILPDGQVWLQGSGSPGHYAIDGTSNLMDWLELTNFTSTNDTFYYTGPHTNLTHRFYRARLMP